MDNSLMDYCEVFFGQLEIYEDINNDTTYKKDLLHAIRSFLNDFPFSTEKALAVYEVFSRSYWMVNKDDTIIRMINEMRDFEEKAGVLTEKQRDHFIHSVLTFILGISIYGGNSNLRLFFERFYKDSSGYLDYYQTKHEEYFYRWGIASLFHDIAYPIEISYNQLKQYLTFISSKCGLTSNSLEASVFIENTDVFNLLPKMNPKSEYEDAFFENYPDFKEIDTNSLALIAKEISKSFGIEYKTIKGEMFDYINKMSKDKYVDHGYYSSLIVLRWFYHLVDEQKWNPVYFYFPIVNAATSIILHNYYRLGLMKAPISLTKLNAENHPLSYLLILCDELQDWGRMPYGLKNRDNVYPQNINIELHDNSLELQYVYSESDWNGEAFALKKYESIKEVLITENVFNKITIN